MAASFELRTNVNVGRRGSDRLAIAGFVVMLALVCVGPMLEHFGVPSAVAMAVVLCGFAAGAAGVGAVIWRERFTPGRVAVDEQSVIVGDEQFLRTDIRSAYFAPAAGRIVSCVRLVGEGDRTLAQVAVSGPEEADRLLDALELGPEQRAARFYALAPARSRSRRAAIACFLGGLLPLALMFALQMPWLLALSLVLWIGGSATFLPCQVHVGADGLLVATRLAPRFVRWSDVESIEPSASGVVVRAAGEVLELPLSQTRLINPRELAAQGALVARARAALAAYRRGDEPSAAARVARRGRSREAWFRALFERGSEFRTAPLLEDELWSVVESPTADATARAGAAAVLARGAGDEVRTRLRVAAEACTAPKLRVVLHKAAGAAGDDEIQEALVEVEDEPSRQASA